MDWSFAFETLGKVGSGIAALAGALWAFEKWRRRDEHFPRVWFEVSVNFLGESKGQVVVELVAKIENKGVVPLKIRDFTFKLRGLREQDSFEVGKEDIRGQLRFPHVVVEGSFLPSSWDHTFIYPGIQTEYNYVFAIPGDMLFVRIQADFKYPGPSKSHHAARILKVPNPSAERRQSVVSPLAPA